MSPDNALEAVDVREVWGRVREWLELVAESTNQDWRPEDIYAACVSGRATMMMPGGDDEAVAVAYTRESTFTGEKVFFLWVVYARRPDAQEFYTSELERVARNAGCAHMEMESPRQGFGRTGWTPGNTIFRRAL